MRLTELNPSFYDAGGEGITDSNTGEPVPRREGIGMVFDCPCGCDVRAYVEFENPISEGKPRIGGGAKWKRTGMSFRDITLTPSIYRPLPHGCGWHGYITAGEVRSV